MYIEITRDIAAILSCTSVKYLIENKKALNKECKFLHDGGSCDPRYADGLRDCAKSCPTGLAITACEQRIAELYAEKKLFPVVITNLINDKKFVIYGYSILEVKNLIYKALPGGISGFSIRFETDEKKIENCEIVDENTISNIIYTPAKVYRRWDDCVIISDKQNNKTYQIAGELSETDKNIIAAFTCIDRDGKKCSRFVCEGKPKAMYEITRAREVSGLAAVINHVPYRYR